MSSDASNEMPSLLKELSIYKVTDEDYRAGAQGRIEAEAFDERERRRQEIKQEIRTSLPRESKIHHKAPREPLSVLRDLQQIKTKSPLWALSPSRTA